MINILRWIALIVGAYLIGSVHFCRLIPLIFLKKDICTLSGDGNPGAANVFTSCGWQWGLTCLLLDMAKGFIPVFAAIKWCETDSLWFTALMTAPVLGHAFSVFYKFKGGKCIATIFGEMIALLWITPIGLLLAGLYILFSAVIKINPHRKRSIITFSLFLPTSVITELMLGQTFIALGCAVLSVIALIKHIVNKNV